MPHMPALLTCMSTDRIGMEVVCMLFGRSVCRNAACAAVLVLLRCLAVVTFPQAVQGCLTHSWCLLLLLLTAACCRT